MCSNMSACYSLLNFIMHLIKNSLGSNTCSNKVHQGYGYALGLSDIAIKWAEILLLSLLWANHPGQPSAWWTVRAWGTSKGHLGHSCHDILPYMPLSALCLVELTIHCLNVGWEFSVKLKMVLSLEFHLRNNCSMLSRMTQNLKFPISLIVVSRKPPTNCCLLCQ